MQKIVIALSGNALGNNPTEQKDLVQLPARQAVALLKQGYQILLGHGNGPQVGMIYNAFSAAKQVNPNTPTVPFAESGAMSQGYIGLHLLTALYNELLHQKLPHQAVYFLTQTLVEASDPAFQNPNKPVGPFYNTEETARSANPNSTVVEDAGRGWRKVVASPKPVDVLGIDAIKSSFNQGNLVIVGGGGGVPTIKTKSGYATVDGVIDKDLALSEIAIKVEADLFVILTAVDFVYINYGQPNEQKLTCINTKEAKTLMAANQFAKGSMLPKVEACLNFVQSGTNKTAIIAQLDQLAAAIAGKIGTKIVK